jgi:hypothetical protein
MIDPVVMFVEGGPFMFLILLSGLLHLVILVAQVALRKYADLLPLLLAATICTVLCGMLGSIMGFILTFQAMAMASAETKMALMANGVSVSMFTTTAALMVALPETFFTGVVASMVRTIRMKEKVAKPP